MTRFLSLFLILISVSIYSEELRIPAPNNKYGLIDWTYSSSGVKSEYGLIVNYTAKDTVLKNGKTYQFWNGQFTRYENRRLYILNLSDYQSGILTEQIYYDFNLSVGDTFKINNARCNNNFDTSDIRSCHPIVRKVENLKMQNGQIRKVIQLSNLAFWVEGIGDLNNTLFYDNYLLAYDAGRYIACFSDSSGLVYKSISFSCDSLISYQSPTNITTTIQYQSYIYPNPTSNLLYYSNADIIPVSISIYNISGSLVKQAKALPIDVSGLERGLYFAKLQFKDKQHSTIKFVKN